MWEMAPECRPKLAAQEAQEAPGDSFPAARQAGRTPRLSRAAPLTARGLGLRPRRAVNGIGFPRSPPSSRGLSKAAHEFRRPVYADSEPRVHPAPPGKGTLARSASPGRPPVHTGSNFVPLRALAPRRGQSSARQRWHCGRSGTLPAWTRPPPSALASGCARAEPWKQRKRRAELLSGCRSPGSLWVPASPPRPQTPQSRAHRLAAGTGTDSPSRLAGNPRLGLQSPLLRTLVPGPPTPTPLVWKPNFSFGPAADVTPKEQLRGDASSSLSFPTCATGPYVPAPFPGLMWDWRGERTWKTPDGAQFCPPFGARFAPVGFSCRAQTRRGPGCS